MVAMTSTILAPIREPRSPAGSPMELAGLEPATSWVAIWTELPHLALVRLDKAMAAPSGSPEVR
jgi:hypothetical protein